MKRIALHWQIFIAIVIAIPLGLFFGETGVIDLRETFKFIGDLFLRSLKMIVIPLIISAIITGICNLNQEGGILRLGSKTISYYLFTSLIAILTGMVLVNTIEPGVIDGEPAKEMLALKELSSSQQENISGKEASDIKNIFLRMVPPNIINAAAEGQMLGLITFSLLFGFFINKLPQNYKEFQQNLWNSINEVMLKLTHFILKFTPIGVLGLIAYTVSETGFDAIKPLSLFFITVLGALLFHFLISTSILLYSLGKINPVKHYRIMTKALLTAFSTSSSLATLPSTIEGVEKAGTSKKVSGFVLPLGATINMDGTALYECVAVIFIAQAYGQDLSMAEQFVILVVALLTSIGVAGIPSASLVAIVIILQAVSLPLEAIGLIIAVDKILDMCRTAVNVWSDSCGAVIIAKTEGEKLNYT